MKPNRRNPLFTRFFRRNALATAIVVSLGSFSAQATDITWDTNLGEGPWDWNTGGNWIGGAAPATNTDRGVLSKDWTANATINLSAATTINGIVFDDIGTTTDVGLTIGNGGNAANTLTLAGASPAIQVAGSTLTVSAVMAGNTAWSKTGAGTLVLSGANTYTGVTNVSAGTLVLSGTSATSGITINGGTNTTLQVTNPAATGSGLISTATGATTPVIQFRLNGGGTIALPNALGGNSGITTTIDVNNNGSGTNGVVQLNGSSAASGIGTITLNVTGGNGYSLHIANLRSTAGTAGTTTFNPTSAALSLGTLTGSQSTGTNTWTLGGTHTGNSVTGIISNAAAGAVSAVAKSNTGTWTLSGANTYTGTTAVTGGILNVAHNTGLGAVSGGTTQSGSSEIRLTNNITVGAEPLSINGGGISNAGALRNFSGNNTYGGTITMAAQSRIVSDAGSLTLSAANSITSANFATIISGAGNLAINGTITTGSGGLTKDGAVGNGSGTLTLAGANTYTGVTSVLAGNLVLAAAAPSGAAGTLGNATSAVLLGNTSGSLNASLLTSAAVTIARPVTVQAGNTGSITIGGSGANASVYSGAITLNKSANFTAIAGGSSTFSGVVSGAGGLTKTGEGIVVLSGTNTFTGPVIVSGSAATVSTLRVANASALGTNASVTLNTGTLAGGQGTTLDLNGTVTIGSGKTLTMNSNTTGDLRSTLLNSSGNNTWAGNIVAQGSGHIQINATGSNILTVTGGITSNTGGTTGTLFVRGSGTVILAGLINMGSDRIFNHTESGTVIVSSTGNSWSRTQVADGQIQVGANDALAVGRDFTFGQNASGNGRLELNGFNQTVARLNSFNTSSGTHTLRNSNAATPSTLTFATPASTTDTLTNVNVYGTSSGVGSLNLVSNGLGRTEFNNGLIQADSWTVNSGTVAFTGNNSRYLPGSVTGLAAATIEKAGTGTFSVLGAWNHAGTTNLVGGSLVLGAGAAGAINVSDGTTLSAGLNGGVLTASSLTFGSSGATTYVPILGAPSVIAPIQPGVLTTNGTTVTIIPQAPSLGVGTYALIDYGTLGGNGFGAFSLGATGSYPHMTASLVDNTTDGRVDLNVTGVDSLIWTGNSSGVWDVNTTSNFALASSPTTAATFYQGDSIVFGDTADVPAPGSAVTNRTLTGSAVTIGNLTFNNSAGNDYSVANDLSGAGSITKTNTGTLTLSGANNLTGAVTVTGGTLKIGSADALRGVPAVTVSNGATIDANGISVANRFTELIVSGAGVGNNGAIVNNGASITNNNSFGKITLAGDATWGGSGRYDVNYTLFNGGTYTLTKTGAGDLWYQPAAGSTLENVIVNQGVFGLQTSNPLSSTSTVTVNAGGTHLLYSAIAVQHQAVLNDGGVIKSNNSTPTFNGSITLDGTTANHFLGATSGTILNIAGQIVGTGGFTTTDTGTVQIQNANNTYAGDTVVASGTLNVNATGAIPTSTNLIVNGGTFVTGNIARTVASLSGSGGTINGGNTLTTTQGGTSIWNGVLGSTTVQMNGLGSITLGGGSAGTGDNSSASVIVNSGTVILAKGNGTAVQQAVHAVGSNANINGGILRLGGVYDNTTGLGTGVNLAPAGYSTGNYVDQIYNAVTVNLNAGTFDLNGRQEAINGLANPAGTGGTVTNSGTAAAKIYIGHQGANAAFAGSLNDGTGTLAVEKLGSGAQTLTGTSDFSGGLTVTAGTLIQDGTLSGTGAIALNGTSTFAGAGSSAGILTAASGTTVRVGTASASTLATTMTLGGLTLSGGANLNLDFNAAGTTVDQIATTLNNGLTLNGTNNVNVVLGANGWVQGTYPILTYTGALQGTGLANLNLTTPVGHNSVSFVDNGNGAINMQVTADSLIWTGTTSGVWDVNTTSNFALSSNPGAAIPFYAGDAVTFGDTSSVPAPNTPVTNRTLTGGAITIGNLTFNNSTGNDYSVANVLNGTGTITKNNTGTLTLTGASGFTGDVYVNGGTLVTAMSNAIVGNLGSSPNPAAFSKTVFLTNNAVFRNTTAFNDNTGSGTVLQLVFNIGTGGATIDTPTGLTMTLDDGSVAGNANNAAQLQGTGDLTKTGPGILSLGNGSSNFGTFSGQILVSEGTLTTGSTSTNPFGTTTAGTTVASGATLDVKAANIGLEPLSISGTGVGGLGALISSATGGSAGGPITLAADASIGGASALALSGIISGDFNLTKVGSGTTTLSNPANAYTGTTTLSAGQVTASAVGALPSTTSLIFSGGTLDPANLTHSVASISGTSGSINQGTAGTGKVITTQSGNTVFQGTVNRVTVAMNGSGSLTLGGTGDNNSAIGELNSGTLILAKGDSANVSQSVHALGSGPMTVNGGTLQLGGTYDNLTTPGTGVNLAPVGINTATYVDQLVNLITVNLNAGTFDLNGRQEAINGLANPAGAGGTVTNSNSAAAKLYIGHQGATSSFGGALNDGIGILAVEKIGSGTQTFSGTSNFTGGLTQTSGAVTIAPGGVLGNTPITMTAGTFTLNGGHGNGAIALNGTSTFAGEGTSTGTLTAASGTTVQVGNASGGTAATTLTLGGLTLSGGANLNLDFDSPGTTVDKIVTTATNGLTLGGTNNVNVVLGGSGWVTGIYQILSYAGAVQGLGASALTLTTPVGHNAVSIVDDSAGKINLVVTSTINKWVGGNGSTWDTNNTLNWNAGDQKFLSGDTVVFDDSATSFTPNVLADQTPIGVTFDNTTPYTLTSTGAFGIAGSAGLIKKNTGTVTLTNANTYTGSTDIQNGTLIANYNNGTATAVLAAASTVNIAPGATFKAIANDAGFTIVNNVTGAGTLVLDAHATADTGARDVAISGNLAGFTGTLDLAPSFFTAGGFRLLADNINDIGGASTVNIASGAQIYSTATNATFASNFNLAGTGYVESAGTLGAFRVSATNTFTGVITVSGSAKIGAVGGTANITNTLTGGTLTFGGSINQGSSETLNLTGNASGLAGLIINDASATSGAANILFNVGNGTAAGTLGSVPVTLQGDGFKTAILRFDRTDGYSLGASVTSASPDATNNIRTQLQVDTTGTGFDTNGQTINLGGTTTSDGAFRVGNTRIGSIATVNSSLTAGSINVAPGATGAVLNITTGASINTGVFFVGEGGGFSGSVNQTAGDVSVARQVRVGHFGTNTSTFNLSGGSLTMTANPALAVHPSGTGEQNGGIYVGIDGTGIFNQSGTSTVTTDWVVLDNRGDTGAGTNMPDGIDRYNLSGGTLEIRSVYGITNRNATTEFNFTGGTLKNVGSGVNAVISGLGNFVIGSGGSGTPTIDTNGAGNSFTITRALSGAGTLAKSGEGTLNLNASSIGWTGNLQVDGGIVSTSTPNGGLGSVNTPGRTLTVNAGGTLNLGIGNALGNGIGNSNLPALVVNGGTVSSTNYNVLGKLTLNGGTLTQTSADSGGYEGFQFRGSVTVGGTAASMIASTNGKANHLGANTTFDVADVVSGADLTVSAALRDQSADFGSAAGSLTKTGLGTMVLTGNNTYTGATNVQAGMLVVNGSLAGTSGINVASGASIGGNGTLNAATTFSGIVAPGNSIGTLTANNDVTWNGANVASSTTDWQFELGLGTSDLLDITGTDSEFIKGSGTAFRFDFLNTGLNNGTYTLVQWTATTPLGGGAFGTNFQLADFSYTNLDPNPLKTGSFSFGTNSLQFTVIPEPRAAMLGIIGTLALLRRRRSA